MQRITAVQNRQKFLDLHRRKWSKSRVLENRLGRSRWSCADAVQVKRELRVFWKDGRCLEGSIDPLPEISVGEEVPSNKGNEVG